MSLRHRKKMHGTVKIKLTGKDVPMTDFLKMMGKLSEEEEKAQEKA